MCAGTSDLPVAEEAAITAEIMGNTVSRIYDVGVAGLHRLLARLDLLSAHVLIVVAEWKERFRALWLDLSENLIAVPTSIGMARFLRHCRAPGHAEQLRQRSLGCNIDNGFGAEYAASQINLLAAEAAATGTRRRQRASTKLEV